MGAGFMVDEGPVRQRMLMVDDEVLSLMGRPAPSVPLMFELERSEAGLAGDLGEATMAHARAVVMARRAHEAEGERIERALTRLVEELIEQEMNGRAEALEGMAERAAPMRELVWLERGADGESEEVIELVECQREPSITIDRFGGTHSWTWEPRPWWRWWCR